MKGKIVYDKPGRLRLRFGVHAFERSHEKGIKKLLESDEAVTSVTVRYENGGILVNYLPEARNRVIGLFKKIDLNNLPEVGDEVTIADIDREFKDKITKVVCKRVCMLLFMPTRIKNLLITVRGLRYIMRALKVLASGRLTVDVLDGASVAASISRRSAGTAGTIMFMLKISSLLEDYTRARTRAALTDSLAVKTDKVWLVGEDSDVLIPMSELKVNDRIRIRTGSVIPVDGEVTDGEAYVNESAMTGEPLPVMKSAGSSVFAGTVVDEGSVVIKTRELNGSTKLQKIIELIDNSENFKAGVQSKAERLADSIVPFSFLGFALTLICTGNVTKAISILMVDYSCAIKLSTPISVISAIREAADSDITVKGGKYLEEFALADSIVFDKTGTLTNAQPVLEKVIAFDGYDEREVLKTAACLEEHFPHSVARAIVKGAADRNIDHAEEHAEVHYIVAHGIATTLHGQRAVIGSRHFVAEDEGISISAKVQREIDRKSGACSVVYLAIGDSLAGVLCISDPPRAEAAEAVEMLKAAGITNIAMLTGDSSKAADITAQKLGIDTCYSQVLPEDKHSYIEKMKAEGHRVIMVGDGINDAPALAAANVSVAMSDASDIAKETADITLRCSDLRELVRLRRLSELMLARINKNYRFIIAFNTSLLLLGFVGAIAPASSAFMHNASTMALCLKSMTPLLDEN